MTEQTHPDWIKPGTKVVTYNRQGVAHGRDLSARITTIKKVNKTTFTVDGEDVRFYLDSQESPNQGTRYALRFRKAVPRDSDEAARIIAIAQRNNALSKARKAVMKWENDRDNDELIEAVSAAFAEIPRKQ